MSGNIQDPPPTHRPRNVIFALGLATAAEGIFLGGVLPILPAIGRTYQVTSGAVFWVSAVFLLAVGVTCPILSRLGDMIGHKKVILLTLVMTVLGIALDIVAPTYPLFLLGRALLGLCPAITPLSIGIFRHSLPERSARFGIGAIAAAMTAGSATGPIVAGYVFNATHSIGWVFASWLVLMVPSVLVVTALVRESPRPAIRARMDWPGAAALAIGVASLLLGLAYGPKAGWAAPVVLGAFVLSAASLLTWVTVERRSPWPLVDLRMLSNREARPYYIGSFLWGWAVYGSQTTVVLFMVTAHQQWGYGFSVSILALAWLLLPQNLMSILGSLSVHRVVHSLGGYRSAGIIGGSLMALGFLGVISVIVANGALWQFILAASIGGYGLGFMQPTLSGRVSEICGPSQRGISAGMFQTLKNIGGSVASALGSAVFATLVVDGTHQPVRGAYLVVFGGCLGVSACMALVIAARRGARQPSRDVAAVFQVADALNEP